MIGKRAFAKCKALFPTIIKPAIMKTILALLFLMTAPFSYGVVIYSNNFDSPTSQTALWYDTGSIAAWYTDVSFEPGGVGNYGGCLTIDVRTANAPGGQWTYTTLKTLNYPVQPSGSAIVVTGLIRLNSAETAGRILVTIGGQPNGYSASTPYSLSAQYISIPLNKDTWVPFTLYYPVYPALNSQNPQLGNLTIWFDGNANWQTGTGSMSFDNFTIQTVTTAVPEPGRLILVGIGCVAVIMARRRSPLPRRRGLIEV
jgi:hypothetical protein